MTGSRQTAAGKLLLVGLPGPALDAETREILRTIRPGGIVLFRRNLEDPATLLHLLAQLREILPGPLLLAIDQEGGRVSRLEPWVGPTPAAAGLARLGADATFRFGLATGESLRALGFNLDLAPVVDLSPPEVPNGIGDRSFGADPVVTTRLAGAFLAGLRRAGVAGCLKHFPGLGATSVDSHVALPTVWKEQAGLEAEDLVPFRRLGGDAACIMVGHAHYPALDPQPGLPASLSARIVHFWLRERLGYRGLVMADDLEMGAVAGLDEEGSAAVAAVAAGCDMVIYAGDLDRAHRAARALARAARAPGFAARMAEACRTVEQTAARWPLPRPDLDAWRRARQRLYASTRT